MNFFQDLNVNKLQKVHAKKTAAFQKWLKKTLQIHIETSTKMYTPF